MPSLRRLAKPTLRRPKSPGRRRFLTLLGGAAAALSVASCRWKERKLMPLAHPAEGVLPGELRRHATMLDLDGIATGVLVSSYDGRPLKVEGNPAHPSSLGGTTAFTQASVGGLYDPDRSRGVLRRQGSDWVATSWEEYAKFAHELRNRLRTQGGRGLGLLVPSDSSPTRARLLARLSSVLPEARICEYESWSRDQELLGSKLALGKPCRSLWSFERARVLLCLDADPAARSRGCPPTPAACP